jgi:hypothetical protein
MAKFRSSHSMSQTIFSSTRKGYCICPNRFPSRVLYLIEYDITIPNRTDLVVRNRRLADRLVDRSVQNRGSSSSRIVVSSIVCQNRWCQAWSRVAQPPSAARRRPTAQRCAQRSTARAVSFFDPKPKFAQCAPLMGWSGRAPARPADVMAYALGSTSR